MFKSRFLKVCAPGALTIALAGCSWPLSPRPDLTRFYLLTPIAESAPPAPAAAPSAADLALGLGPVKLPAYLDRPEVVTRAAPNRLELSKTERWGESLQNNFAQVLARDLAARLGTQQIVIFPWYNTTRLDLQVQVDVFRFEADAQGNAQLSAKWTIFDATGRTVLYTAQSNFTQAAKPGDATEAAAALSRAVGDLSREIANLVTQVRAQNRAPRA